MKKKITAVLLSVFLTGSLLFSGCSREEIKETIEETFETQNNESNEVAEENATLSIELPEVKDALNYRDFEEDACVIMLEGTNGTVVGEGAELQDGNLIIRRAGDYVISGEFQGSILVEAGEKDDVYLYLNGVSVKTNDYAAIACISADNLYLSCVPDTQNELSDAKEYVLTSEEDKVDSTIYSSCDLVINGTGTLSVNGNYRDAITGKDDVVIMDATISVIGTDDGIVGKDSLVILSGVLDIEAVGDGLKATNAEDSEKGFVYISDGTVSISSDDDGIHAESILAILGGDIAIEKSYEGLEGAKVIINGGKINIISSDDGINVAGGTDDAATDSNDGMGEIFDVNENNVLEINGGEVYVNATGDGLDSNGNVVMSDGQVFISGPTDSGNGTLDFAGNFSISGGTLVGTGSSGMLQYPNDNSEQNSIVVVLTNSYDGGTQVALNDSKGNVIVQYEAENKFNSVVISAEEITEGETYSLLVGDNETVLTIEGTNTLSGTSGSMNGMGGMGHHGGTDKENMGGKQQGGMMGKPGEEMTPPDAE